MADQALCGVTGFVASGKNTCHLPFPFLCWLLDWPTSVVSLPRYIKKDSMQRTFSWAVALFSGELNALVVLSPHILRIPFPLVWWGRERVCPLHVLSVRVGVGSSPRITGPRHHVYCIRVYIR